MRKEPRRTGPLRILELRSVRGTGGGPEKTILAGAAQADPQRYAITVCYVRDRRDPVFAIDQRAELAGVDYVEVNEDHSFDPGIWRQLTALVRDRAVDIVHGHDYKTNLLAYLLGQRRGVIPMATSHGWTGHSRRERWLYYPADRRVLTRLPAVVAVSNQIREELIAAGASPSNVTTIPNGIDHVRFARRNAREPHARRVLGVAPDALVIGAVGRLEPQKRFDLLIDACAGLQKRWPRLTLAIVGDGSLASPLREQASRVLAEGSWRLVGHRDDIIGAHHAFDVFVQSSDYEGTPNAVLEAMALETPIVATSAGGTDELCVDGEHGLLVPSGRLDELVRAIAAVIEDPTGARARVLAARRRVETVLSFERRMRRLEALYDALADSRTRAAVQARSA